MERIWAAIDGGVISSTFIGDDAFANVVRPDHDEVFEITGLLPQPGVGWKLYEDGTYRPEPPFPSWVWDVDYWHAPVPYPSDGRNYRWDEAAQSWVENVSAGL